jgi:hypothetical protein
MRSASYAIVIIISIPLCLSADTINVPGDYQTIQEAIDASANGDTVLVEDGDYYENIDFKGKAIKMISDHPVYRARIHGGSPPNPDCGSVVTFNSNEGLDSVLEHFLLHDGRGTFHQSGMSSSICGGGIFCLESSPTIKDCEFYYNTAEHGGGGRHHG